MDKRDDSMMRFVEAYDRLNESGKRQALLIVFWVHLKYTLRKPTRKNISLVFGMFFNVVTPLLWRKALLYSLGIGAACLWIITVYRAAQP